MTTASRFRGNGLLRHRKRRSKRLWRRTSSERRLNLVRTSFDKRGWAANNCRESCVTFVPAGCRAVPAEWSTPDTPPQGGCETALITEARIALRSQPMPSRSARRNQHKRLARLQELTTVESRKQRATQLLIGWRAEARRRADSLGCASGLGLGERSGGAGRGEPARSEWRVVVRFTPRVCRSGGRGGGTPLGGWQPAAGGSPSPRQSGPAGGRRSRGARRGALNC